MDNTYTVFEEYELPSKGEIYEENVSPIVKLRSMTTNEEMKRLGRSDRQYKNYASIIDDCIVEPIGISAYDLCLGDYEFLLHKLRVVTYGSDYKINVTCPNCFDKQEATVKLDDFKVKNDIKTIKDNLEFQLPITKKVIKLKMQTPRNLDNSKVEAEQFKKSLKQDIGNTQILFTLKSMIDTIDGEKPNPITINDELRNLPMKDVVFIVQKSELVESAIGLDTTLDVKCEACGNEFTTPFRLTSEFYGPTLVG